MPILFFFSIYTLQLFVVVLFIQNSKNTGYISKVQKRGYYMSYLLQQCHKIKMLFLQESIKYNKVTHSSNVL